MTIQVGYCTNVHAGVTLAETRANLQRYALEVKKHVLPDRPMGIGLWLPESAARQLASDLKQQQEWTDWLRAVALVPFTFNGFPYGDFHQAVVKHHVYFPTWYQPERVAYTMLLIANQDALLAPGVEASISTLPLAWGQPHPSNQQLRQAAHELNGLAAFLEELEQGQGRLFTLCLEPEPGCVLQRSSDVVRFYEQYLLSDYDEARIRRHIRVCHDICHAAVMFEDQADVLHRYRAAGIEVGKIQVSSAVVLSLDSLSMSERTAALRQLGAFAEDRYLHQTVIRRGGDEPLFYEDLPQALAAESAEHGGEWRVHFHVPIHLNRCGLLQTSQAQILECVREAVRHNTTNHFEVETYAWGVLPTELQEPDLAAGIAKEMQWFQSILPAQRQ